jgi:hypothetical protein
MDIASRYVQTQKMLVATTASSGSKQGEISREVVANIGKENKHGQQQQLVGR